MIQRTIIGQITIFRPFYSEREGRWFSRGFALSRVPPEHDPSGGPYTAAQRRLWMLEILLEVVVHVEKRRKPGADSIDELEQYRRLLDNIPAEIGVFDLEGRFLFNTPSGIRDPAVRQWVLGKTHHEYCRKRNYPMSIADKRQSVIDQCINERRSVSFEELWVDKSGRRRYYVRTFSPVVDAAGNATHVIGYGHEITELKKAEEALRATHEELEAEVAVRREAEQKLRSALEEVEELRDRLQEENIYLQEEIKTEHNFDEIIGQSPAIKNVLSAIETVAPTEANVVIMGETGTGKELVARGIHGLSPRKDKPLVKVNCASIPKELFESEFFGHVKGAFTGAVKDRAGRFQIADEGILFLDEVGEIPLEMQSKLLRVLQDGEYERVGEEKTRRVDVRIIAATNRDLKQEVEAGRFRQDLYYRLTVFPIEVAPLRRRTEDIPLLATHYLEQAARKTNRAGLTLTQRGVRQLQGYEWPGNVRELQNVIERAVITARGGALRFDLPDASRHPSPVDSSSASTEETESDVIPESEMRARARENMLAALRRTGWRIYGGGGAAELLGIRPTTLASRMKKMGLSKAG